MRKIKERQPDGSTPWRDRALLPLQIASEITGVSVASLYRFESEKRLIFRRLGGRTLVDTPSLIALVDSAETWVASTAAGKAIAARTGRGEQAARA